MPRLSNRPTPGDTTTARSSLPREILASHEAYARPKCSCRRPGSAAANSPTVVIPMLARRSFVRGPITLAFFTASGRMRDSRSAIDRMVGPSGMSSSEPMFASNLLGAVAIEQVPVSEPSRR